MSSGYGGLGRVGDIPTTFIPQARIVWIEFRFQAGDQFDQQLNVDYNVVGSTFRKGDKARNFY